MEVRQLLGSLLLLALFGSQSVLGATKHPPAPDAHTVAVASSAHDTVLHFPLYKLSEDEDLTGGVIRLRSTEGAVNFSFGNRLDHVVESGVLHLRFNYSPALIPVESHIKVLVNNETVKVISIPKEYTSVPATYDIPLDPRLITDYNRLTLIFIGHYTNDQCEDPLNTTLWADVDSTSDLELKVAQVPLKNDLGLLPAPFFDSRDGRRVEVPFVFPASPSLPMLQSAGIVSSWIGKLADWRGGYFPASYDSVPQGNAIVFATNGQRPGFLRDHPTVNGPTLEMIENPTDNVSRILVVMGRDDKDLHTAALALALGSKGLSGTVATVAQVKEEDPRQAYDAPRWLRLDRPVKLGELVDSPDKLQVFGHAPLPIRIHMRVAPDIFAWRSLGVPVDLKYRYTPPYAVGESRLVMSVNHQLVQSFNLKSSNEAEDQKIRLPLMDSAVLSATDEAMIPPYKMWSRDDMSFRFTFAHHKVGLCRDTQVGNTRAMIDPDSTIDLSGYPHYAEMPNLASFVSLGFPFTKYADLQETTVVLPSQPNLADVTAYLSILGHLGADTGYPATRFVLAGPNDGAAIKDRDILVIGDSIHEGELKTWDTHMPALVTSDGRLVSQPKRSVNLFYDWLGFDTRPNPDVASLEKFIAGGPLAVLTGFESPVSGKRSVVSLTASQPEALGLFLDAIDNPSLVGELKGSVAFIHAKRVDGVLVGDTYKIGHLPFWTSIWYPLSRHPVLLMLLGLLAVILAGVLLWRALAALASKKNEN